MNDRIDLLRKWRRGKAVDEKLAGSPEYRAKREFMRRFVELLHEMGAHEFARQYEWSTAKSQPNCLKLIKTEKSPEKGLVAIDFRAGLTLLPFLPMSPGDFKLILKGLARGSLVQFDRGDIDRLEAFIARHADHFRGLAPHLARLRVAEKAYRDSMPDITHNRLRILYDKSLWSAIREGLIESWENRDYIDADFAKKLRDGLPLCLVLWLIGLLPAIGSLARGLIGHRRRRAHYGKCLTSPSYLMRTLKGHRYENAVRWLLDGRILPGRARDSADSLALYLIHLTLSFLPAGLHRFLTQWDYFRERMRAIFIWPFRLCFDAALREAWLREMVHEGRNRRIITREDEAKILSRIKEPFVQKFLKNMAVHVLTFPMTRIVSVSLAVFYLLTHPEVPRAQAWAAALGILAFFQLIPVSPGSLTRGLYVLYLVIRERNLRDYSIALPVSFLKTTGYLSFPIQMAYSYPALARFMAVYWATGAVHAVPVFGEKGALLEHWVFSLFYNLPLTMRRRIRERAARRSGIAPRAWHIGPVLAASSIVSSIVDCWFIHAYSRLPRAGELAPMAVLPLVSGVLVAAGAGGASSRRRIAYAALAGACMAVLCALVAAGLGLGFLELFDWSQPATRLLWNMFLYPFVAALSAAGWELVTA